ncbi:MAG: OB-fold nucleic acid binding domain-containing protein, partial [Candidatus Thalassarchaeaceae archaeon]|nr:OB-fold nucleic acid binding domain-containing protein [Candidatus Thalassarchaeaceae archaeon]
MRDSSGWRPTAYRSHAIGQVVAYGADMVGSEVTVAGYAETVRGRGAICFLMLRDGTGRIQAFLKKDNMDEGLFDAIQSATRESTIQVTGTVAQKRPPKVAEGEPSPPAEYEVNVATGTILADAAAPLPVGVTDDV